MSVGGAISQAGGEGQPERQAVAYESELSRVGFLIPPQVCAATTAMSGGSE